MLFFSLTGLIHSFNIVLFTILSTKGFELVRYYKTGFSNYQVLKESSRVKSDLQCCSLCNTDYLCEGVKYFDNLHVCELLFDVEIDETSEIKDGWVTANSNAIKSMELISIRVGHF